MTPEAAAHSVVRKLQLEVGCGLTEDHDGGTRKGVYPLKRPRDVAEILDLDTKDIEVVWEWIEQVVRVNQANN